MSNAAKSRYIVSAWYNALFFLLPPTLALLVGIGISDTPFADDPFKWWGWDVTWSGLLIGVFIHAHLVLVFIRSHANQMIFQLHKLRFVLADPAERTFDAGSREALTSHYALFGVLGGRRGASALAGWHELPHSARCRPRT